MRYCGCSLARTMFFGSALLILFTEAVAVRAEQQPKVEVVPAIGHSSSCTSVAFSPDGARVLSASWNGTVKLWDVATGQLIRTFAAGSETVSSVAFSPDGARVLSGHGDSTMKLWDAATGRLLRTFTGHSDAVQSVAFSGDGTRVLSGSGTLLVRSASGNTTLKLYNTTLKLWDVATGRLLRTFTRPPDEAYLAKMGLPLDPALKARKIPMLYIVRSVAFSPNGLQVLSGHGDWTMKLWDAATGRLIHSFRAHSSVITSVAFSPDGARVLSGSLDGTVKLWDAATGRLIRTVDWQEEVLSVAFSPDGARVLSGHGDSTMKLWDAATGQLVRTFEAAVQYNTDKTVAFSPNGAHVLSCGEGGTMKLWDAATGQLVRTFEGHSFPVTSVAFSPDGTRVLTGASDTMKLWDAATGQLVRTFEGHRDVTSVAFSPDGTRVLSGGSDYRAKLWDAATGQLVHTFEGHVDNKAMVTSVAFSPDGTRVLTGASDTMKLWDAATGQLLHTFVGPSDEVLPKPAKSKIKFVPGGLPPFPDSDSDIWRNSLGVTSMAFSPDGTRVLSGHAYRHKRTTMKLWDAATGQLVRTFEGHRDVTSVAFSPDGTRVLSGSWDKPMTLWDAATGQVLQTFEGHSDFVTSVAFSPDGTRVLSGSLDRTVKLWDAATGRLIRTLAGHGVASSLGDTMTRRGTSWSNDTGIAVAFSSDGTRIVAGSADSTIQLWNPGSGEPSAMFLNVPDGEWLVVTPAGFFASSRGAESLSIVRGLTVTTIQQVFDTLYRPDLVVEALKGDPESKYGEAARQLNLETILQSGPAPQLELLEQKTAQAGDTVRLSVRITDTGGGIGRKVVWRVNGRTQGDLTAPALEGKTSPSLGRTVTLTQGLRVDPGQKNMIDITAYNGAGLLASPLFRITVDAFGVTTTERPRMHVLAIGVDAYAMKDYALRYAAKDAKEFAEALRVVGSRLFAEVKVTRLFAPHVPVVTKAAIETAFGRMAHEVKPTDVFVLFLGGHGKSINGRYYFYPQDIDFAVRQRVEEHGIGQDDWQQWLAKIAANKKVLILDTCESAAAAGLIRGGERERQTAMDQLQFATGDNLIAAARQAAYEGYREHGVLTYTILEALTKAQDSSGDDRVDVDALARHVGDRVPVISQSLFGIAQAPIRRLSGQNFPLGLRVAGLLPDAPPPTAEGGTGFVLLRDERVREKPAEDAPGERMLETATTVDVVRFIGQWALIASDGVELGYVPADAVKKPAKPH